METSFNPSKPSPQNSAGQKPHIPENPQALLTRDQAAAALTALGFPIKAKTLATKATRGGGPAYRLFGQRVLYRWCDVLEWAQGRLSSPRHNTSEADLARSAVEQSAPHKQEREQ